MLRAAFVKAELEFLRASPSFSDALDTLPFLKTTDHFERLCYLGEELLAAHYRSHPAESQLRTSRLGAY